MYPKTTPTVFGPNDATIQGVSVDISDVTTENTPQVNASSRVVIQPVSGKPGTFTVSLGFIPRSTVIVRTVPPCNPETFNLDTLGQEQNIACQGVEGSRIQVATSSDDVDFDQLSLDIVLPVIPDQNPQGDGIVLRAVVGATTALATIVSLLVVYVYMGPRAAGWMKSRAARRLERRGKRPIGAVVDGGASPPQEIPSPPGAENADNPAIELQQQTSFDELALMDVPLRTTSAVVPIEVAAPLFSLPPPESFNLSDVVVVRYEGLFDDTVQHFKGRIVEEKESGATYKVLFVDADVDDAVDPDCMRLYQDITKRSFNQSASSFNFGSVSSNSTEDEYQVTLEKQTPTESYGLKIGWTTNDRVVVTGFTPGSVAFGALVIQLGDEILEMNGQRVPSSFEEVTSAIRNSGTILHLKMRSHAAAMARSREEHSHSGGSDGRLDWT